MPPSVSAASWPQAAASSRRSEPTASSSARAAPSSARWPARRNSALTKSSRSANLVSFGHSITRAPAALTPASNSLPLAPPACVSTRTTSGAGFFAYLASSAATSLLAFWAARTTSTQPPPNSEGEVSDSSSPGPSSAPSRSWTSPPSPASRAAVIRSRTLRSTRNSSSPTTSTTGARSVPGGFTAVRAAMTAACHVDGPRAEPTGLAGRDWLAAEPDAAGGQPVGPDEGTLVVGVPQDHVGEPAADHGAAVGGAQRVRAADGGGPQGLLDAHPEVGHGQRDDQGHRGDTGTARVMVGAKCDGHALVQHGAHRRPGAGLQGRAGADHRDHARLGEHGDVILGGPRQQVGGRAAHLGGQPGRAGARVAAGVQPRQQARAAAGVENPARLVLGEPAFLAVHVHAVRADHRGVRAPGAD